MPLTIRTSNQGRDEEVDDGALGLGEVHELDSDSHDAIRSGLCISHHTGKGHVAGSTHRKPDGDTTSHEIRWMANVHSHTEIR